MKYSKIQDRSNLIRDMKNGAVLNIDNSSLDAYRKTKRKMQAINNLEQDNLAIKDRLQLLEDKIDRMIDMLSCNK